MNSNATLAVDQSLRREKQSLSAKRVSSQWSNTLLSDGGDWG